MAPAPAGATAGAGAGVNRYCHAMDRLPYLRYDDLGSERQKVWDSVVGSRGPALINEQGGLIGPFNAFVHARTLARG